MHQNRKILFSFIIGISFSAVAVYISFRNIPLAQLIDYMGTIDPGWVAASLFIGLSSYLVRALRWKIILAPVKRIGFWHAYHPLVIAFMINCILPGRVGELARPAIIYKRDKVDFSKVLATIGAERIFDFITLLGLFIFLMSGIEMDPGLSLTFNGYRINRDMLQSIWSKTLLISIILVLLIFMLMMPVTRRALSRFLSWLPHLLFLSPGHFRKNLSDRIHIRSHVLLENLSMGFQILRDPRKVLSCIGLSLVVWGLIFLSFYVMSLGCAGVNLSLAQASTGTIIVCFFIMLPSVPGYWGVWEAGGIYSLMLFGVPKMEAAGLTLVFHFFQIIPVILIGLISAWITGVGIMQAGLTPREGIEDH